jgi:hypothetical protein
MAFNYSPKIITDGLVLYLDAANTRSYPTTGTIWSDLSRNNNNGTLTNGPTFNSANGGSIVFDGVNDYVALPTSNIILTLSNANQFTYEFFCYQTALSVNNKFLISNRFNSNSNKTCVFINSSNKLVFGYRDNVQNDSGNLKTVVSNSTLSIQNFYHFIITFNSFTKTCIYINGLLDNDAVQNNNVSTTNTVYLELANLAISNETFRGNIYFVRQYNRALTAQEVLQNYNATKSRFGLT